MAKFTSVKIVSKGDKIEHREIAAGHRYNLIGHVSSFTAKIKGRPKSSASVRSRERNEPYDFFSGTWGRAWKSRLYVSPTLEWGGFSEGRRRER